MAIQSLKQHFDRGARLPLYHTLPTGRSVESLCDRLGQSNGIVPGNLMPALHLLADQVALPKPQAISYRAYAPLLKEIAIRLTMPFDRRRGPNLA